MGDLFTPMHILLIVLVALLFFGPSKLPELGRGVGKMLREFKAGTKGLLSEEERQPDSKPLPVKDRNEASRIEIVDIKHTDENRLP